MAPSLGTLLIVAAHVVALAALALLYLRRVRMDRPPIGVFNRRDIFVITMVVIAIPPVYLRLPDFLIAAVFCLVALILLQVITSPLLGSRWSWLFAAVAVAVNIALALRGGGEDRDPWFFAVNNVMIVLLALGVANLWVQAGLRARYVALFALLLTGYDIIATAYLPVMVEFFFRVVQLPFAPAVAWGDGPGMVGVGVGDLLVIALWITVVEKAYGGRAALVAGTAGVLAVGGLLAAFWVGWLVDPVPAMVTLGPVVVIGYLLLTKIYGPERTTGQYYATRDGSGAASPPSAPTITGPDRVSAAVPLLWRPRD